MQPSLCLMFDEPAVITLGGVIDAGGINHVPTRTFVNRTRHAWAEGRPPYGTYFLTNRSGHVARNDRRVGGLRPPCAARDVIS
jgi:hypothetical protein